MTRICDSALLAAFSLLLFGCTVGPNYNRPDVSLPASFRSAQPAEGNSFGDEKWPDVFRDSELQKLIHTGLDSNYDVRIAATRILQARAQVGLTRSNQFPNISGTGGYFIERVPGFGFNYFELIANFSWDVDFWGKYRRATEGARAQLLASEWNRREVIATVVANIATYYFDLRELDLEDRISRQALASRKESLQLTQTLLNGGAGTLEDVRQSEQLVETAAGAIPDLERQIAQTENAISTLTGQNPGAVPRGRELVEEPIPEAIPSGVPSRLLERRPDIRAAEQQLVAANANIGVARAQFFPDFNLTGSGGLGSKTLGGLFTGNPLVYTLQPGITQQIFTAGRLRANLKLSEAQEQQYLLTYRQTILQALQQVSDALMAFQKYREYRAHEQALAAAAQDAARLSELRYRGGAASYLEVLTNETNYYTAEIGLARAQLSERLSLVQVYQALGGGWEQ
jgi:outer membrane protein, multidrug efflux system